MSAKAPIWVLIVLAVMTLLPIAFTVTAYVNPAPLFGSWSALNVEGALSLAGPMGFYLARNIATICVSLFALATRAPGTLKMALLLRVLTDAMDGAHFILGGGDPTGAVTAFVIAAIELAALVRIWRLR